MPKERKFIRPLQYFTHNDDISWGDILSWGYLEDLQVYAIRREQGVQYFEFLSDIKTLPWWDVEELVQTKHIKQFYYGLEVKQHDQHLWNYIKLQAKERFPDCKPQFLKQIFNILESGEKDITLDIKPPRCLKNMPLRAMEQDFYEDFQGWMYNQSTAYWKSKWRDLEIDEFLKKYKRSQQFKEIAEKAARLGRYKLIRPPPTNQTPIDKEENKIPRWDRKRDGDPEYRKYWNEVDRPLRQKMLAEKEEKRRQRAKERRRSWKTD
ncbi:hypothetical protein Hanom_Chr09g00792271 [Helianthus anomalus]